MSATRTHLVHRSLISATLVLILASTSSAALRTSRVFRAGFEQVWEAGLAVSQQAFVPVSVRKSEGTMHLRSGPFRGYSFVVTFIDLGRRRTRVEIAPRANYYAIERSDKESWRHGVRYLRLLADRLNQAGEK